ncbi:STAS domain-containing protein [Chitinilyticum aquatile]|uniref:STAS domain-containing protein n=1 Tax=Chitinilyticum aquatile TaxID=362520 RepID=UPI00041DC868|nr:STAS domain-containing protein [Chitinilyticum aquatile]
MRELHITGPLTMQTAAEQLSLLDTLNDGEACTINLAGVSQLDSSAVALLLHWLRVASQRQLALQLTGIPDSLRQLLRVYALSDLLPGAAAPMQETN